MFRESRIWDVIVDNSSQDELKQLFDIYHEVHKVYMIDYRNPFNNLRWHILYLEDALNTIDEQRNGFIIDGYRMIHPNLFMSDDFNEARELFQNDEILKKSLIEQIRQMHTEIDLISNHMPIMLCYWKELKALRNQHPTHERTAEVFHKGMMTHYHDIICNPYQTYDPVLTLYHIDGNLPIDSDESDDCDDFY